MELYQCPHLHHCHYHQDRHDNRHRHHDHCHHDHCHHGHDDIDCSEEQGQGGFSAMQQNPALMQADFFLFDNLLPHPLEKKNLPESAMSREFIYTLKKKEE